MCLLACYYKEGHFLLLPHLLLHLSFISEWTCRLIQEITYFPTIVHFGAQTACPRFGKEKLLQAARCVLPSGPCHFKHFTSRRKNRFQAPFELFQPQLCSQLCLQRTVFIIQIWVLGKGYRVRFPSFPPLLPPPQSIHPPVYLENHEFIENSNSKLTAHGSF